jgi:hypothetical protein
MIEGAGATADPWAPRRALVSALYRPAVAQLIIVGEAPPPDRFFYTGDSLFFQYTRRAFAGLLPEVERRDAGWFLAFFRELGGWRIDVCDAPQRATKGGSESITHCLCAFERRWALQPKDDEAVVLVSPKRLLPALPAHIRDQVTATLAPPGQWNAHRQAFLRDLPAHVERHVGRDGLREAAQTVDEDDARLDFDIARACAESASEDELKRLLCGHPREEELVAAFERASTSGSDTTNVF